MISERIKSQLLGSAGKKNTHCRSGNKVKTTEKLTSWKSPETSGRYQGTPFCNIDQANEHKAD
jgi:hypothetical protein